MTIATHPTARPATIKEAVDLYEARLLQFQHIAHAEVGQAHGPLNWLKARRLLLLAEQYLAEHDAHADYQAVPGTPGITAPSDQLQWPQLAQRGRRCAMNEAAAIPGQLASRAPGSRSNAAGCSD